GSGVQDIGGRTIRILNKDAYIGNLDLKAGTLYYVTAIFRNKGLPVPPSHPVYKFDIKQYDSRRTVGGERFLVKLATPAAPPARVQGSPVMENKLKTGGEMQLFPNPTQGNITIALQWAEEEPATVTVTNTAGKLSGTYPVQLRKGENLLPVNTALLPPGAYLVSVITAGKRVNRLFLKK
ncbi:MAG: T9SS type A sorting domain-containing protein, partial [Dinghuibacter sp.]|nr:T9SS type A sorting domain-containing protein [Dinghuibacter sp.]